MSPGNLLARARGRYQRFMARHCFKRPVVMRNTLPLVSFTFDDFPRSALHAGGAILHRHGAVGTYYASFGLMGQETVVGRIFVPEDLELLLSQGHELGCHTFGHCPAWYTSPEVFEESIIRNREAAAKLVPTVRLKTLSYPIDFPRPFTKRRAGRHFSCCRSGGEMPNTGTADLNHLRGYFIERSWGHFDSIQRAIDTNRAQNGWLIFTTHDVADRPGPYGCTPEYFERIVRAATESGARILPVSTACEVVRGAIV